MCKVSFWILFIWVYLIISITLDLVLRQSRFSLRVFNLSSRFSCVIMSKPFFTTWFCFHRFYRVALIRFTFCRGSLDSVFFFFFEEVNTSTLENVIAILIILRNSILLYYVNKHSGSSLSSQYSLTLFCSWYNSNGFDKENLLNNQGFLSWWSFPLFSWPFCFIQGWYCKEKLDVSQS